MLHDYSDQGVACRTPVGYQKGKELEKLMTLGDFLGGGYDVEGVRVLVCVKSVGCRRQGTFSSEPSSPSAR